MTEHLIRAAKDRHDKSLARANKALQDMAAAGSSITFAAVARHAGVSTDFLYKTPTLRARIADLRASPSRKHDDAATVEQEDGSTSSAVRALAAQLRQQRRQHRGEVDALQKALAAAHGENLQLRRRLSQSEG
ncbi:hypothetical protein GCM10028820_13400 [Tessaracoccus terricola]